MPIADPSPAPEPEGSEPAPTRPDERERDRTREYPTEGQDVNAGGEIVAFPGAPGSQVAKRDQSGPPAVMRIWWDEARQTAGRAVDGSVWRSRPPSLRDSHARLQRAEWSAGVPALRWAGWVYGYPALVVRALLRAADWLVDHPSRLLIAAAITAVALIPLLH